MLQIKAKLLYNKRVKGDCWRLALEAPRIAKAALPGQFLNIKVNDGEEPLLRRPFSIHRAKAKSIEILYQVLGEGTEVLSQGKAGGYLDIIGPLGNGFNSAPGAMRPASCLLVAGGMGVAPLVFLAEKLREIQNPKSKIQNIVLIGAKTKNQILCGKEFKNSGFQVKIATDDGSSGFKGHVSDLLKKELRAMSCEPRAIYACGPKPMLKEISRLSKIYNIPAQISLEEHMACGIGACLGCAVNTKAGYKRVCKEGPVFDAKEIIW